MADLFQCNECNLIIKDVEVPTFPHPTQPGMKITCCPKCDGVETFEASCSEPGCKKVASCGTPTQEDYIWSCYEHRPKRSESDPV